MRRVGPEGVAIGPVGRPAAARTEHLARKEDENGWPKKLAPPLPPPCTKRLEPIPRVAIVACASEQSSALGKGAQLGDFDRH